MLEVELVTKSCRFLKGRELRRVHHGASINSQPHRLRKHQGQRMAVKCQVERV